MTLLNNLPLEMPWGGRDVPHGLVEVNQFCNINCFGCCKDKSNYKKSLEEIKSEIDLISSKRNLGALSIAGGEPMVYPQLPDVISYIKSKGIIPWMLSNGTLITKERAKELYDSGLRRILLHIDSEQIGRPDVGEKFDEKTLNELRKKYVDICYDAGLEVGFTTMVYRDKLEHFSDVVNFAYSNPKVVVLLVMGYCQELNLNASLDDKFKAAERVVYSEHVYEYLKKEFSILPSFYLGSSKDKKDPRWLFYIAFLTHKSDDDYDVISFSGRPKFFFKLILFLGKLIDGPQSFFNYGNEKQFFGVLKLYSLFNLFTFRFNRFKEIRSFLEKAKSNGNLRKVVYLFQNPPKKVTTLEETAFCDHCPDITVRNGKLIPTCAADIFEPIEDKCS